MSHEIGLAILFSTLKSSMANDWMVLCCTAWKVSKYGVISGPNTGKYGPVITPYLETFHAVLIHQNKYRKKCYFSWRSKDLLEPGNC